MSIHENNEISKKKKLKNCLTTNKLNNTSKMFSKKVLFFTHSTRKILAVRKRTLIIKIEKTNFN